MLVLVMVFALAACGTKPNETAKPTNPPQPETTNSSEPVENTTEPDNDAYKNKASYKIIEKFVEALKTADYDTIMGMIEYPANSVVQKDDLIYYLMHSDFGELLESESITIENFDGSASRSFATLKSGADTVDVRAYLADDNEWYIDLSDSYEKDTTVLAPAQVTVTLNGFELDKSTAQKHSSKQGRVIYTVAIPRRAISASYDSTFGPQEKELEIRTASDSEAKYTVVQNKFSDELKNELLSELQTKLNTMFELYESGNMEISVWQALFDEDVSLDEIETIQEALEDIYTWNFTVSKLRISQMLQRADSDFYLISSNTIMMHVQFETSFDRSTGSGISRSFGVFCLAKLEDGSYVFNNQYPMERTFTHGVTNSLNRDW